MLAIEYWTNPVYSKLKPVNKLSYLLIGEVLTR